jgi:hypothetical protein
MLSDTHPDAERVQIELLRRTSPEERLGKALNLTSAMLRTSRQTIAALNPGLNEQELGIECVELYYGKELATQVRRYLDAKDPGDAIV